MNKDRRNGGPLLVVEGLEDVIKLDLDRHKEILSQAKNSLVSFRHGLSHELKKKKHYKSLIGGGKYNDDALKQSIQQININIRHMSDKVKITQEKIAFEDNIVQTLTKQLAEQEALLLILADDRKNRN